MKRILTFILILILTVLMFSCAEDYAETDDALVSIAKGISHEMAETEVPEVILSQEMAGSLLEYIEIIKAEPQKIFIYEIKDPGKQKGVDVRWLLTYTASYFNDKDENNENIAVTSFMSQQAVYPQPKDIGFARLVELRYADDQAVLVSFVPGDNGAMSVHAAPLFCSGDEFDPNKIFSEVFGSTLEYTVKECSVNRGAEIQKCNLSNEKISLKSVNEYVSVAENVAKLGLDFYDFSIVFNAAASIEKSDTYKTALEGEAVSAIVIFGGGEQISDDVNGYQYSAVEFFDVCFKMDGDHKMLEASTRFRGNDFYRTKEQTELATVLLKYKNGEDTLYSYTTFTPYGDECVSIASSPYFYETGSLMEEVFGFYENGDEIESSFLPAIETWIKSGTLVKIN